MNYAGTVVTYTADLTVDTIPSRDVEVMYKYCHS
jgi:hypothetical protein